MIKIKENLWDRFFNRLSETEANEAIRILKQGGSYKDIDFFTLKEAEHQVSHHRQQAKSAIAAYRQWKKGHQIRRFFAILRDREGAALRIHAKNMASLFLDSRRDFNDLSNRLMSSISNDAELGSDFQNGGQNAG
jgi:hypothetical protein